ncbi:serine protease 33-like [Ochotona princeps]|uniref:serine protease 33-like n=1 Tax=Ochotona princeps TaxID=9978 RepID=UPI0027155A7E|nr:serine protease 33-like [Ochotona princeps]
MGPAGWGAFLLFLLLGISGAEKENPMSLLESICGRPAVTSGIASGRQATVGQWPWQASIRQGSLHICSATLISKKWVLTMASCFWSKDVTKYSVLVGSLQITGHPDPRMTIIPVSRIITHPDFSGNIFGALAVVELAYPVSYGPVVLPICLPSPEVQLKNTSYCWVTGWGYSGTHQYSKTSYTLKELRVPLIDLQTCNNYYQNANLTNRKEFIISEATICSLIPVKHMDQCIGNRGDPLMCQVDDFWVLAGIVTWGTNCIQTNEPGIYTNISFYKSWIEKTAISFTELSATPWIDLSGLLPVMLLPLIFLGPP